MVRLHTAHRRFAPHMPEPEKVRGLKADHPAVTGSRPLFPVTPVEQSPRVLVSGHNNCKIGKLVTKGAWAGMPIYTLTLAERSTCPQSCEHWRDCFAPETRVLTADMRWKPIAKLMPGERIVSFDEEPGESGRRHYRIGEVEALRPVRRKRYRIHTDQGSIVVSGSHEFLARRRPTTVAGRAGYQWLRADTLAAGETIRFFARPWEEDRSYDAARVRGFMEGEGSMSLLSSKGFRKTRLSYSQVPGPVLDEITEAVRRIGYQVKAQYVRSGVNLSDVVLMSFMGSFAQIARFLGSVRPTRFVERSEEMITGHVVDGRLSVAAKVKRVEELGVGEVWQIATSTKTLIAEGFLAHNCYGNAMHRARRLEAGPVLEDVLVVEVMQHANRHPDGFVVRLHVLGDFYSVEYVDLWRRLLRQYPALHIYGYTAYFPDADDQREAAIGQALAITRMQFQDRFRIRFSGEETRVVTDKEFSEPGVLVCPAEKSEKASCGSCAWCWERDEEIAFILHGMMGGRRRKPGRPRKEAA